MCIRDRDTAVDPVHLKGRSHSHDLLVHLAESLQEIADSHVGTGGGQDIRVLCADEFRVFMQKSVRLRVDVYKIQVLEDRAIRTSSM